MQLNLLQAGLLESIRGLDVGDLQIHAPEDCFNLELQVQLQLWEGIDLGDQGQNSHEPGVWRLEDLGVLAGLQYVAEEGQHCYHLALLVCLQQKAFQPQTCCSTSQYMLSNNLMMVDCQDRVMSKFKISFLRGLSICNGC